MFCTQIQKIPYFEPTLDYIMLHNFGTVRPIFTKIASKVAQDSKEKSHESAVRGKKFPRNYRVKRRGGVIPPPPPGLIRVKGRIQDFFFCRVGALSVWRWKAPQKGHHFPTERADKPPPPKKKKKKKKKKIIYHHFFLLVVGVGGGHNHSRLKQ